MVETEIDLVGRVYSVNPIAATPYGLRHGGQLGHRAAEGAEVVDHGLIDQHIAVGEEEDSLASVRLPQPPNDLKCGVGLASPGRHDEEHAVSTSGDGLEGGVDSADLVVARCLAGRVVVVVLKDDILGLEPKTLPGPVARPQFVGRGKGVQRESVSRWAAIPVRS